MVLAFILGAIIALAPKTETTATSYALPDYFTHYLQHSPEATPLYRYRCAEVIDVWACYFTHRISATHAPLYNTIMHFPPLKPPATGTIP